MAYLPPCLHRDRHRGANGCYLQPIVRGKNFLTSQSEPPEKSKIGYFNPTYPRRVQRRSALPNTGQKPIATGGLKGVSWMHTDAGITHARDVLSCTLPHWVTHEKSPGRRAHSSTDMHFSSGSKSPRMDAYGCRDYTRAGRLSGPLSPSHTPACRGVYTGVYCAIVWRSYQQAHTRAVSPHALFLGYRAREAVPLQGRRPSPFHITSITERLFKPTDPHPTPHSTGGRA